MAIMITISAVSLVRNTFGTMQQQFWWHQFNPIIKQFILVVALGPHGGETIWQQEMTLCMSGCRWEQTAPGNWRKDTFRCEWSVILWTRMLNGTLQVVLAMVLGYPAAVWNWIRIRWSCWGWYPKHSGTHWVRGHVGTGLQLHFIVLTTLAPIKYLNSDCIAIWSIGEMCRLMLYCLSNSQIWGPINIASVAVKSSR